MAERQEKKQRLSALLIDFMQRENLAGRKLAERIGVSQPSAQAYIDGVTFPGEETRKNIARSLGMTFEELQAYLDDVPVERRQTAEDVCREIRAMSREEFAVVMRTVCDRVVRELETGSVSSPGGPI